MSHCDKIVILFSSSKSTSAVVTVVEHEASTQDDIKNEAVKAK